MSVNSPPPQGQPLIFAGDSLDGARLALVILHGMSGDPVRMVKLAERLAPPDVAILAPSSPFGPWWPKRFLEPVPAKERHLTTALAAVENAVREALDLAIEPSEIVIAGFSQGACLALEHAARAGRPYRAVVAMTGALPGTVGKDGTLREGLAPARYSEDLTGVRFALTTHEDDPQIPAPFVQASAEILRARGALVETYIAPGNTHELTRRDHEHLMEALSEENDVEPQEAPAAAAPPEEPEPAERRGRRGPRPKRQRPPRIRHPLRRGGRMKRLFDLFKRRD